jgi:hypothetical protein
MIIISDRRKEPLLFSPKNDVSTNSIQSVPVDFALREVSQTPEALIHLFISSTITIALTTIHTPEALFGLLHPLFVSLSPSPSPSQLPINISEPNFIYCINVIHLLHQSSSTSGAEPFLTFADQLRLTHGYAQSNRLAEYIKTAQGRWGTSIIGSRLTALLLCSGSCSCSCLSSPSPQLGCYHDLALQLLVQSNNFFCQIVRWCGSDNRNTKLVLSVRR